MKKYGRYQSLFSIRFKTGIKEIRKNYERERLSVKEIIILYHCYFVDGSWLFSGILIRKR